MPRDSHARRHRWANAIVIVAAVYALLAAVWSPPELYTPAGGDDVGLPGWLFMAYVIGGFLGLVAVFVALKEPFVGKVFAAVGGLALLAGLAALRDFSLVALASLGISGLALLAAAPFLGPMPTPEDEGQSRKGWGEPDPDMPRRS